MFHTTHSSSGGGGGGAGHFFLIDIVYYSSTTMYWFLVLVLEKYNTITNGTLQPQQQSSVHLQLRRRHTTEVVGCASTIVLSDYKTIRLFKHYCNLSTTIINAGADTLYYSTFSLSTLSSTVHHLNQYRDASTLMCDCRVSPLLQGNTTSIGLSSSFNDHMGFT